MRVTGTTSHLPASAGTPPGDPASANMGDHRDVEALARLVGDAVLRDVLQHAEAGQFGERAWTYWHYRLGLADVGRVPPLPTRRFS